MSVVSELRGLSVKAQNYRGQSLSEKDTERLLVEPFIDALGYDTRDLGEVETQPRIQVGSTEVKCDYAIKRDGAPLILIECKKAGFRLDALGQLSTYFERERAVWLGVYTNGLEHRFYGGSVSGAGIKQMDAQPFLTLDLLNFDDRVAECVAAFAKGWFDPNEVKALARRIRDTQLVEEAIREELRSPSDGLVRLLMDSVGAEQDEFDHYEPIVNAVTPQLLSDAQPQRSAIPAASGPDASASPPQASAGDVAIRWKRMGAEYHAVLQSDGFVRLPGDPTPYSPGRACSVALGNSISVNGWLVWKYQDEQSGRWRSINDLPNAAAMKANTSGHRERRY